MKNIGILFFAASCFLCSNLFAEPHRDAWASKSFPNNPNQKVKYVGYGDTAYMDTVQFLYIPHCFSSIYPPDINSIVVDSLKEMVDRFVVDNDYGLWEWNYDHLFRVVEVKYTIKCANNLRYEGTEYLVGYETWRNPRAPGYNSEEFRANEHEWQKLRLDALQPDGIVLDHNLNGWGYPPEKFNKTKVAYRWLQQAVEMPPFSYMGIPGKLPRPVLLIHGLDSDYKVWGVKPDTSGFKEGKVEQYESGSLPDMLARSNNLYTKNIDSTINDTVYNINSNGIYFFQSPKDNEGEDAKPHWGPDSNTSQSRALYEKIKFVMKDFYDKQGKDWTLSDKYQIDLVGHSQGGLVIREMLRGLRDNPGDITEKGNENPANHINRVITVNTPHFGSALATDTNNLSNIEGEFPGVATIIRDIENPIDHTLVEADVNSTFWEVYKEVFWPALTIPTIAGAAIWGEDGAILGLAIGAISGLAIAATTDVSLTIKGPYLGVYKPEVFIDLPGPRNQHRKLDPIETVAEFKDRLEKPRKSGNYLDKNDNFIKDLNAAGFPLRPDGSKITLLPMYSDSTDKIIPELLEAAGEESNKLCAMGDADPNCFAAGVALQSYIKTEKGYDISKPEFDNGLWDALLSIQNDWLKQSDAVVEVESQKFINNANKPDNEYFLEPRKYAIHDALAPWEPVLHGPFGNFDSAPQQGLDLLCALSPACDKAFADAQGNGGAILKLSETLFRGGFNENYLEVVGDFNLAPVFISEGTQTFSISANGTPVITATYEPGKGSSITLKYGGIEQTNLLLGPEFATQPSMTRKGDSVYVTFTNYSGKPFQEVYYLPGLSNSLTVTVRTSGSDLSPVIIGTATAANPETQKPAVPPPGHRLAPITLAVLHREARVEHESNTSRPRFLVFNATEDTLEFSKVAYYFTADPARVPKVEVDYPQVSVSVENLGGDQWRFVFDVGNKKLAPKAFYPSADGWQIRVHYSDWYEYKHLDDWSADYSIGLVQLNRKIVVYDKNGKIIWGNEAPGFKTVDDGIIPTPKGTIAWKDDAPWENNTFKPRVTVKNTGSVALSDYHAQLWFRVPQGKNLSPLDVWYAPESSPTVKNVGGRVRMLDLHFNKHILYSGDSLSEGNIGLHLTDWSNFDKTVCGIVLRDKDGNILFGKEPSIAECESYNGPNLLMPLYSLR